MEGRVPLLLEGPSLPGKFCKIKRSTMHSGAFLKLKTQFLKVKMNIIIQIEITSWLVSAYDFYARVTKNSYKRTSA